MNLDAWHVFRDEIDHAEDHYGDKKIIPFFINRRKIQNPSNYTTRTAMCSALHLREKRERDSRMWE